MRKAIFLTKEYGTDSYPLGLWLDGGPEVVAKYVFPRAPNIAPKKDEWNKPYLHDPEDCPGCFMKAVLISEFVCSGISRILGSPTPASELIEIPANMLKFQGAVGTPSHASSFIKNLSHRDGLSNCNLNSTENVDRLAKLSLLNEVCGIIDRQMFYQMEGEMLVYSVDHGWGFGGPRALPSHLDPSSIEPTFAHVGMRDVLCDASNIKRTVGVLDGINEGSISPILAAVPEQWMCPHYDAGKYISYVLYRKELILGKLK